MFFTLSKALCVDCAADPVEVYNHGIVYVFVGVGYALACPPVAHAFAPFIYNLKITSTFEV